jgi:hypothetical protein
MTETKEELEAAETTALRPAAGLREKTRYTNKNTKC